MKLCCAVLLALLLAGCSASARMVRLDTRQGAPLLFIPHASARPVELGAGGLKRAMEMRSWEVPPSLRPREAARRLFEMDARSASYVYSSRGHRLIPLDVGENVEEGSAAEVELTRAYLNWCQQTGRTGDCLRLLTECPTLDGDGRFALALGLAQGVVLDELLEAFKDLADPHAMVSAALWTWTTYMILLSVPEPISKGIAAVMTATLISYLGVDTFWGLIVGFRRLMDEADRATTFNQLRVTGERYGKVMGRSAARAFAMLAMLALNNTAQGMVAQVPRLPGAMAAAVQAETQLGISLASVGVVETVAVGAEAVSITLAPIAVAMTARGTREGSSPKDIPISNGREKHIFRSAPGHLADTPANRQLLQEVAADKAARMGTDRFGNEWFARTNPDGTQVWVQVRKGEILNGGLNPVPLGYNSQTGLSAPSKP